MSTERELKASEQQHAHDIYQKYGNDPQALSQAVWKDLQKIDRNDDLKYQTQLKSEVEQTFLESLSKESHDHHKKAFIEFTDPYGNHNRDHVQIGTSRGFKDSWACTNDMKDLSALKPINYTQEERNRADGLYGQLGDLHNNLGKLQNHFMDSSIWTCPDEASKTQRDHIMKAFAEKANQDKHCPYRFDLNTNDKHVLGFSAVSKHTGKVVQDIQLHDDRY